MDAAAAAKAAAAERKRKRLEAWRKRQKEQKEEQEQKEKENKDERLGEEAKNMNASAIVSRAKSAIRTSADNNDKNINNNDNDKNKKSKISLQIGLGFQSMKGKKKRKKFHMDTSSSSTGTTSTLVGNVSVKTSMSSMFGDLDEFQNNNDKSKTTLINNLDSAINLMSSNSGSIDGGIHIHDNESQNKRKRNRWDVSEKNIPSNSTSNSFLNKTDSNNHKNNLQKDTKNYTHEQSSGIALDTNHSSTTRQDNTDPNSKFLSLPPSHPSISSDKPKLQEEDPLDKFMDALSCEATGSIVIKGLSSSDLTIDVGGSMALSLTTNTSSSTNPPTSTLKNNKPTLSSGGVITPEDLEKLNRQMPKSHIKKNTNTSTAPAPAPAPSPVPIPAPPTTSIPQPLYPPTRKESDAIYGPSDWESENPDTTSISEAETDDEEEEKARRSFIEALKKTSVEQEDLQQTPETIIATTQSELKSEKQKKEDRLLQLQNEAMNAARASALASQPEIGRIYNDSEDGVMEEAERTLNILNAAPDALEVLAELNKKKELKAVDHSSVDYIPFRKNLYIVPRSIANLEPDDIVDLRAKLKVKVRGQGAPAPVSKFADCGLSERILSILTRQKIQTPYPVQAQCLPCIMAGRDVIGIAKTGSGKTLAYLLPMLRHIADQPGLAPNESGPIGLVLAPARELAVQIHHVTKVFAKNLGLKSTALYGGAGVAEQIADLKRGTHIAVATPGRMIDILTMQSGKLLSLQRVSYVVMDEADRMFDMGFAPQISAILSAVRPDRQTVLFSATFPKAVETLARKSLKFPIEVIVGGRSVASDSVTQYGEVIEEEEKFLRLLQLLGDHVEGDKKVIVFVDTQVKADSVFEQLVRCGYPSMSLHGGKEQEDRDSTISDFKRLDGPSVLVATSVAGRGLDVPSCVCVINYAAPNHLEDYVHRVGRTGRAGEKGVSYTFVNSGDEAKYAPLVVRAMMEAGQSENIQPELRKLSDEFKEKVKKGEARYAGSGFKGKGYTYDSSELNDAQKLVKLEKRQALIEAGMIDPDDDDPNVGNGDENTHNEGAGNVGTDNRNSEIQNKSDIASGIKANFSADMLALPGMKEAILKKAGIEIPTSELDNNGGVLSTGSNHFVEEIEINDYPREARWKVTQKETTSRLQDEFETAVTLKGQYFDSKRQPEEGERKLYLHLEATSERVLQTCIQEIRRLLNEETLRVGSRGLGGGSHRYNVLG